MTTAGKRIAQARIRARMTGRELALAAGVTPSWVRSVETGRTAQPAADKLSRVADTLGLDVRELLALTDQLGAAAMVPTPAPAADNAALVDAITALVEELRRARQEQAEWNKGIQDVIAGLSALVPLQPTNDHAPEHHADALR